MYGNQAVLQWGSNWESEIRLTNVTVVIQKPYMQSGALYAHELAPITDSTLDVKSWSEYYSRSVKYARATVLVNWVFDGKTIWYITLIYKFSYTLPCATSRTVPGSIPGGVTGIFSDISPSDQTMARWSTQPLVVMSTRNIPGGKGGRCVRLTTYHHIVQLSRILGALTS